MHAVHAVKKVEMLARCANVCPGVHGFSDS